MSYRLARLWPKLASRLYLQYTPQSSLVPVPPSRGLGILLPIPQQKVSFLIAKRFKLAALWAMIMAMDCPLWQ